MKYLTHRDEDYLNYIRTLPCTYCMSVPIEDKPNHPHHEPLGDSGGYGLKSSDYFTVPLCGTCHSTVHLCGAETFWEGFDIKRVIIDLMSSYISTRLCVKEAS
ncbi:hypothetical protein ACFL3R_00670 [Thermodesulfobacteriota bacterium]